MFFRFSSNSLGQSFNRQTSSRNNNQQSFGRQTAARNNDQGKDNLTEFEVASIASKGSVFEGVGIRAGK